MSTNGPNAVVRVGIPLWSHKQIGKLASEGVLRWFYIIIRQRMCSKDLGFQNLLNISAMMEVRKNTAKIFSLQ